MNWTKQIVMTIAGATLLVGAQRALSAEVVGLWDFSEFTGTSGNSTPSDSFVPYANHAASTLATAGKLGQDVGDGEKRLVGIQAAYTKDNAPGGADANTWLLLSNTGIYQTGAAPGAAPTPLFNQSYLSFTITADQDNLKLTSFDFELGVSVGSGGISGNYDNQTTNAQLFYSTDNGVTFNPIGDVVTRRATVVKDDNGVGIAGSFTGMLPASVDLSSIGLLTDGQQVQFRLAFTSNRGIGTGTSGTYLDSLSLSAEPIPEPATVGLLGAAATFGLLRRTRGK